MLGSSAILRRNSVWKYADRSRTNESRTPPSVPPQSGFCSYGSVELRHRNASSISSGKVACAPGGGIPASPEVYSARRKLRFGAPTGLRETAAAGSDGASSSCR
jgi:hypothetical protein